MMNECYLSECKYHSKDFPECTEKECINEEIIKVNTLLFEKIRKNCLDFESVS